MTATVIAAQAGIQSFVSVDSRLRGSDYATQI